MMSAPGISPEEGGEGKEMGLGKWEAGCEEASTKAPAGPTESSESGLAPLSCPI